MPRLMLGVFLGLAATGMCRGGEGNKEEAVEPALVRAWAEKLSVEFLKGGDRILVYEAVKPGKPPFQFTMAECRSREVAAARIEMGGEPELAMGWFALAGDEGKSLWAWQPGGEVLQFTGFDRFMEHLTALGQLMGGDGERQPLGLSWELFLTRDSIDFHVGAATISEFRRAPWLKPVLLQTATDVEVGKKEIVFLFPEDGRMVVRKDGVLLRQEFPVDGVDRKLRLVSEEKMEKWSVAEYFPKFDPAKVEVTPVEGGPEGINVMQGYYLGMVRKMAEMEDGAAKLDEGREKIVERMLPLYRPIARRSLKENVNLAKVRIGLETGLGKAWENAREEFPDKAREMTYTQFIDEVRASFLEQLGKTDLPAARAVLPPVLDPEERAGLTVQERALADRLRELATEAMMRTVAVELFETAAANEKKRDLE